MTTHASPLALLNDPTLLKTDALINGKWVKGKKRFDVQDPATGSVLVDVADLEPKDVKAAIAAADAAWPAWRALTGKQRHAILMQWFRLLMDHQDDLARIMTAEQGKPLTEARGEVVYGASFVEWFAEEAKRVYGETIPTTDANKRYLVIKQPIGVCAAITPWNFPIAMITRKVAPALAAGCPVVIKPAEQTPLSALAAAELAQRAGMPAGVLNVLSADSESSIAIGGVLCVEGYAGAAAKLGSEAANILRRKVAVRLRSALRASDVVAAMGPDAFGVLLGHVESPGDGERVAAKLVRSLQQPFMVAGQPCAVAAAVGLAHTPEHGKDAESLLQRASAQAGSLATLGRDGFAASTERGPSRAANDDPV